jgi:hypothetical protein
MINYNDVTPVSWAGSVAQLWVGSAIADKTDIDDLRRDVKPTRIINCRIEFDDAPLLRLAGLPADLTFYLWDGVKDWTPIAGIGLQPLPDSFFRKGLDYWNQCSNPNEVVFVHCTQGINRSVTLTYAILLAQGLSRIEAMVQLNLHRPQTGLSDIIDHPWRENAEHALHRLGYAVR